MKKALLFLLILVFISPLYAGERWGNPYNSERSRQEQERIGELYRERQQEEEMKKRIQESEDRQDRIRRGKNPNDSTGEELIRGRPNKFFGW